MGKVFVTEQHEDPPAHDLLGLAGAITCPVLLIHGKSDPTVPATCAHLLAEAIGSGAQVKVISGGNHVFNTPNPMPPGSDPSPQLGELLTATIEFAKACCKGRD